ncbi:MAG: TetR/AcrR family transcriptional regulator [Clostridia bacterium]|nr:TetR/AcrR family transcriptional regulator [Clostridia bacterium]
MPRGEHRNDRRVRRTKKLLVQALTQLMSEKQVNEITVKELTQLADVNRGTFYLYYSDIYDMLHTTQNELLAALEDIAGRHRENSARGELSPMLEELFEHIGQNSEMWRVLLSPTGDMSFLHRLNQLLRESFSWMQSVGETPRGAAEWDFRYSFGVFGCAGLIRSWLDSGLNESPSHMAALTDSLLRQGVLAIVDGKK